MVAKRLSLWLLALCVFTAAGAGAEIKIAVLDFQRAVGESEDAKQQLGAIREELQKEEDSLNELVEEIQSLREKLQNDAEILGDNERRTINKDIENKQVDYQFGAQKLQKELQDRQQELMRNMAPKLDAVLKDLIEIEGYDVVMTRQSLLYVNTKHDITRKVTEKLNEKR